MTIVLSALGEEGVIKPHVYGDKYAFTTAVTFSSTYKTGGDATLGEELKKLLAQLGSGIIDEVDITGDTKGYNLVYNYETNKLVVYRTGAAVKGAFEELPEEAYPAAITGAKVRVTCIGS
jgi:hypothetical protein